jgi:hypothetical protein
VSEPPRYASNTPLSGIDDDQDGDLSAILRAIAGDVSGLGASAGDGIRAMYAASIVNVQRSGMPAALRAATIFGLKQEMVGALAAMARNQASETSARVSAAILRLGRPARRRQSGDDHLNRAGPAVRQKTATRAERTKSFKVAAKATLTPAPAAPISRRRRGGRSGGMMGFRIAARDLAFRPAKLPSRAYDPAVAYLEDTLHWLELWDEPEVMTENNSVEINLQNLLSPNL